MTQHPVTGAMETLYEKSCGCGDCYAYEIRFIKADLNKQQCRQVLAKISYWKLALGILSAPFMAVGAAFTVSREDMINLETEDMRTRFGRFSEFIFDAREAKVTSILKFEINAWDETKSIAIEYGVGHMNAFHDWLIENGYSETGSREVQALAPTKKHVRKADGYGYGIAWARFEKKRYGHMGAEKTGDYQINEIESPAQYYNPKEYRKPKPISVTIDPSRYLSIKEVVARKKRDKAIPRNVRHYSRPLSYENPLIQSEEREIEVFISVPPQAKDFSFADLEIEMSDVENEEGLPPEGPPPDDEVVDTLSTKSYFRKTG